MLELRNLHGMGRSRVQPVSLSKHWETLSSRVHVGGWMRRRERGKEEREGAKRRKKAKAEVNCAFAALLGVCKCVWLYIGHIRVQ